MADYDRLVEAEGERLAAKQAQLDAIDAALRAAGYSMNDWGRFLLWKDRRQTRDNGNGKLQLLTVTDLLHAPPVEWLIEDVLFDKTFSILGGYTGFGKSLLCLEIAKSIAGNFPLFGRYRVNRSGPVLFVDQENSHSDLGDRLRKMRIGADLPLYWLSFQGILLDDRASLHRLADVTKQLDPVLVVFDSLVRFHHAKENDAGEMAAVMAPLREMANAGIGVLVQHHHTKSLGALEVRARGSSDIIGASDVEYALYKNQHDQLVLQTVKSRRAAVQPLCLEIVDQDGELFFRCVGTALDQKRELRAGIVDLLEKPHTLEQLADELANGGSGVGLKALREHVRALLEEGKLRVETKARNRKEYSRV